MEQDDKSYEQVFRQEIMQSSRQTAKSKSSHEGWQKWLVIAGFVIVVILLIAMVVISIVDMSNDGGQTDENEKDKTALMVLYEHLEDEMTYAGLQDVIKREAPEASIVYDDGMYMIVVEDENENENDYITCNIRTNNQTVTEEEALEEGDATGDEVDLEKLLNELMSEEDSEEDEENESEANYDPYSSTYNIMSDTIMTYFKYYYYGEVEDLDGNLNLVELFIQDNADGEGYDFFNGVNTVVLPTKSVAIDELLNVIK